MGNRKITEDFRYENLKGTDTAIHCTSQEEWDSVCEITGFQFNANWFKVENLKEEWIGLQLNIPDRSGDHYKRNNFTIIEAKDFIAANSGEVVGYKAPCDLFDGKIKKGDVPRKSENGYTFDSIGLSNYLPKEIVETWEPVYEKKLVIEFVSIGTKKVKITNAGVIIGTRAYTILHWENLFEQIKENIVLCSESEFSYSIHVETVSIGCEHGVKLKEIENLINVYYKLNPKK